MPRTQKTFRNATLTSEDKHLLSKTVQTHGGKEGMQIKNLNQRGKSEENLSAKFRRKMSL